jgi:hypothetical protein
MRSESSVSPVFEQRRAKRIEVGPGTARVWSAYQVRVSQRGIPALRGKPLFRASQPGELCVQQSDGFGSGWLRRGAERGGLGSRNNSDPGAAGALVAPEGSAAARSDEAQLQRGLVEEDIGVVGHKCLPNTTLALLRNTSKQKVLTGQPLTIKEVRSSEGF